MRLCGELAKWLEEIGWENQLGSFGTIRVTSYAWPRENRCGASWSVHQILSAHRDRFDMIHPTMTAKEAHQLMGHSVAPRNYPEARTALEAIQCIQSATRFIESASRVSMDDEPSEILELVGSAWAQLDLSREDALERHGMA
jgi:hypothetical protein